MKTLPLLLNVSFLLGVFLLVSCNQQTSDVKINTTGIFVPITFGIDDEDASGKFLNKGEWVTSDGPKTMTIKVQNNTFFPYSGIDIEMRATNPELITSLRFKPNNQGDTQFPGLGGTCQRSLGPGLTCTIVVEFMPLSDGFYDEQIQLNFKNWVEDETHLATLSFISGEPAELIFDGTPSKIPFGTRIGSNYIIERTISKTYDLKDPMFSTMVPKGHIEVKNVGGLTARDILIEFNHKCSDNFGSICVDDPTFGKAFNYKLTPSNCGVALKPGEVCKIELFYQPKNTSEIGLPPQFERIKYEGTLAFRYIRRPDGQRQTLGLTMESISSKIEGFLASNPSIDLSNSGAGVIQGNEASRKIRIENIGFSKVRFKKMIFTKSQMSGTGKEVWAICERVSTSSNFLHCYKPNSNILYPNLINQYELANLMAPRTQVTGPGATSYEELPFVVEDLGQGAPNDAGCFFPEGGNQKAPLIEIGGGCFLNVIFKPSAKTFFLENTDPTSLASLDAPDSNYSVFNKSIRAFVLYDSQWKYGEDHCSIAEESQECPQGLIKAKWYKTDFSFEILAKRRAAAKVIVQDLTYNQSPIDLINDSWTQSLFSEWNFERSYQLRPEGRIELLAYNQRNRPQLFKKFQVTLSNIGGTTAILESPLDPNLGISWVGKGSQAFSFDGQADLANLQDVNNCLINGKNECFYRNLSTLMADCRRIEAKSTCTLSISYAPFSIGGSTLLQGKANFDEYPAGEVLSWSSLQAYNSGDYVTYNGLIYKALSTHGARMSFNPADWAPLSKSFTISYRNGLHKSDEASISPLVDWAQLKQYALNDEVIYEGIRFKCKVSHTSGINFDLSKWERDNNSIAQTTFKVRSKMISVGKIEEMADNFYNQKLQVINTKFIKPSEVTFRYWFTNIGAGQVAHFNLGGVASLMNPIPECTQVISEGGTGGMSGKDCRCYSESTPLTKSTSCTSGAAASDILASEESCYIPMKWNLWMDQTPTYPSGIDFELVNYVYPPESPVEKRILSNLSYKNCYTKSNTETETNYDGNWGYLLSQPQFVSVFNILDEPAKIIPRIAYSSSSPWHVMGMGRVMGPFTKPNASQTNFDPQFFYWNTNSSTLITLSHGTGSQAGPGENSLLYSIVGSVNYFNPALRTVNPSYDSIDDVVQGATSNGAISYYLFLGKFSKYSLSNPSNKINVNFELRNVSSTPGTMTNIEIGDIANTTSLPIYRGASLVQSDSAYNLTISGAETYSAQIDPALCSSEVCVYSKYMDITYDTNLFHKDWNGSTFANSTTRPENAEKKIRVILIAEVDATSTQPVEIAHGDYQGLTSNVCPQTFNPFTITHSDWNQSAGKSNFTFMTLRTEKNRLVQKAIKFKNTSTKTIKISSLMVRVPSNVGAALTQATDLGYWGISLLLDSTDGASCNYPRCSINSTLAPGAECYNVIRFNPTRDTTGSGKDYYLTYLVKENSAGKDKSHELLNLPINLATISPSRLGPYQVSGTNQNLLASNLSPYFQNLSGWNLERNPYRFSIPDFIFQGRVDNGQGGYDYPVTKRYFRIRYLVTTDAKSSFLAQYRDHLNNQTAVPHPVNHFSDDPSLEDGTGTLSYTLIWEKNLNSVNHGLMKIFASKDCIFGDNPPVPDGSGNVIDNGSGFDRNETDCWLRVELSHQHKNMFHQTNFGTSSNAASSTVSPYLAQLKFYSVSRTSIASMSILADFKSRPKNLNFASKFWSSINAHHTGGTTINQTQLVAQVDPNQSLNDKTHFGEIVGYRLIRSNSLVELQGNRYQGAYPTQSAPRIFSRKPAKPSGVNNNVFAAEDTLSSMPSISFNNAVSNRIYYFKLMAIVTHPGFTNGISLFDLSNNNYFLVETDLEVAKVITPNNNYNYNHKNKILIQKLDLVKFANSANKKSYSGALSECSSISQTFFQEIPPTSFARTTLLMDRNIWNLLPASEINTEYWIRSPAVSFNDSLCGGFEEYSIFSNSLKCRKAISSTAPSGQLLIGNLSNQNLYPYSVVGDYVIENHSSYSFGFARCFIDLTNLISPNLP